MEHLLERWNKFLFEARSSYHFIVDVIAEKNTQLYGSIFDKIRAIPGVTIVKTLEASRTNEMGNKVSRLDIKFLIDPNLPGTRGYLEKIRSEIKTMKDDQGDRVLAVRVITNPEKTDVS